MTSKPGRRYRCATVLWLSGLLAGLFGGCVGVKHHLHRHMPFAHHDESHEAGYYHCDKCGRVIPHSDGCGCGEIIERPNFGYNATCWQPWPGDWPGCPEGDEAMVSGDPFLQVPVDSHLPVSDPSPPTATPDMFWDDPSARNDPVLPPFRPQSLPVARPAVESAEERGNELAEQDAGDGSGLERPPWERPQELFGPSETVAEVPADPPTQNEADLAPAVLARVPMHIPTDVSPHIPNPIPTGVPSDVPSDVGREVSTLAVPGDASRHVPVNWYFNSLGRDESLVRKLMQLRTARSVRPAKRIIEDSTVRFSTFPDDDSPTKTDEESDRGRFSQSAVPSPSSTVRLMIPR